MKLFSRFDEDGDDFLNETELRKLAALIYPKTIGVDSTDHWNKVAWEFWCNFVGGANRRCRIVVLRRTSVRSVHNNIRERK